MQTAQQAKREWAALAPPKFLVRAKRRDRTSAVTDEEPAETGDWDDTPLPKDMIYIRAWLLRGIHPTVPRARYGVVDAPYCGYGNLLGIKHEESVTLFDPSTMSSWRVPRDCAEIEGATHAPFRMGYMIKLINEKWALYGSLGTSADFDAAARFLRKLGARVPTKVELTEERRAELLRMRGGQEKREGPSGGKPMESKMRKPVKRDSKRGKVLQFFLKEGVDVPRSIREAMAEFSTTRSNILSTLFILNKDHGLGYVLQDDAARVRVPLGELWS